MVAQDGVNQGAALLLTSVGKARELGIPRERWVFLHGMADGMERRLSERPDIGTVPVAARVLERSFAIAGLGMEDVGPIDVYSCFPCAVSVIAECLGLPDDGTVPLTLTGGLPYFGGPGNNYVMHAIAEMVQRLRREPQITGLVTANGGVMSKHAAGLYSCRPSPVDWAATDTCVPRGAGGARALASAPAAGRILSYTVNWAGEHPAQAVVIADTADGERFVASTRAGDQATVAAMLDAEPSGRLVEVTEIRGDTLHFRLGAG
jgi:acetyl-CoA C-acetyltransferase